jgi:hypothetical protein
MEQTDGRAPVRVAGALLFHADDRLLTLTIALFTSGSAGAVC